MSTKKKVLEAEPIRAVLPEMIEAQGEAAPEPEQEKESVVYLGPDIDRTVNHGTVFQGGELPGYLEEKIKQIPAIRALIVPVSRYAEVAREIRLSGSRCRTLYDTISNTLGRR